MAPSAPSWQKLANTLQLAWVSDYSTPPLGLQWRTSSLFIVSTVAIGLFSDLFLYGLIVPILPFMLEDRVGIPQSEVQSWVSCLLTSYAAASVLFSPVAGFLADRVSTRQAPFLLGLLSLLASTTLLFLGRTIAVLVVARVLQGISAAVVWTVGMALCTETVGSDNLGKTIGSVFSFISVGNLAAPVLGGVLYEKRGYPGVFGIAFALLAVDFIMRLLVIEKKVAARYESQDPTQGDLQQTTSHDGGHAESQEREQDATEETSLLGRKEEDQYKISPDQPAIARKVTLLPCLKNSSLVAAFFVSGIQAAIMGTFDATIPTVARQYYNFPALKAGLLFLPLGLSDLLLGPVFGWAVDRFGTKPVATLSYLYLVPILFLLRLPQPCPSASSTAGILETAASSSSSCSDPTKQIAIWASLLFLAGAGLAGASSPSIVEAGFVVKKFHERNPKFFGDDGPYAQMYGVSSMVFGAGLTVGPLLAGSLKERIGYGNMNAVMAAISAVTAVLAFVYIGRPLRWRSWRRGRVEA